MSGSLRIPGLFQMERPIAHLMIHVSGDHAERDLGSIVGDLRRDLSGRRGKGREAVHRLTAKLGDHLPNIDGTYRNACLHIDRMGTLTATMALGDGVVWREGTVVIAWPLADTLFQSAAKRPLAQVVAHPWLDDMATIVGKGSILRDDETRLATANVCSSPPKAFDLARAHGS